MRLRRRLFRPFDRVRGYVVVQRLDNLRRSGRIGTAASWLSTALAIKPVLRIDGDGRLVLAQRVRTASKALAAMVEQVMAEVGERRGRRRGASRRQRPSPPMTLRTS